MGQAERLADNKDSGDHSSGGSESGCEPSIVIASSRVIRNAKVRTEISSDAGQKFRNRPGKAGHQQDNPRGISVMMEGT
jgi:hypothetical protein